MKSLNKIAESSVILLFGFFVSKLLSYIFRIIVARRDIELYGSYNLAITIINLIALVSLLGLNTGILRYISYYNAKKDKKKSDIAVSSSLKIILPVSIFFFLVFFFFSDLIAGFFNVKKLEIFLKYFSFLIPVYALFNMFSSILRANKKVAEIVFAERFAEKALRVVIVSFMFFIGFEIYGIITSFLISAIASLTIIYFYSKKFYSFRKGFDKEILFFSLPLFFSTALYKMLFSIDSLFLGYFTNAKDVALFNIANPSAQLLFVIQTSLLAIFLPIIAEKHAKNKSPAKEYQIVSKWLLAIVFPIILLIFLFGKEFLLILFGKEFVSAYFSFAVLSFFYAIYIVSISSENILIMAKKTKLIFYIYSFSFFIGVILNIIFIPYFYKNYGSGINGAAIARSIAYFLIAMMNFYFAYRATRMKIADKNTFKLVFAGLICFVAAYILKVLISSIVFIILIVIGFMLAYLLLLFFFDVFGRHEKEAFKYLKNILIKKRTENDVEKID